MARIVGLGWCGSVLTIALIPSSLAFGQAVGITGKLEGKEGGSAVPWRETEASQHVVARTEQRATERLERLNPRIQDGDELEAALQALRQDPTWDAVDRVERALEDLAYLDHAQLRRATDEAEKLLDDLRLRGFTEDETTDVQAALDELQEEATQGTLRRLGEAERNAKDRLAPLTRPRDPAVEKERQEKLAMGREARELLGDLAKARADLKYERENPSRLFPERGARRQTALLGRILENKKELNELESRYTERFGRDSIVAGEGTKQGNGGFVPEIDGGRGLSGAMYAAKAEDSKYFDGVQSTFGPEEFIPTAIVTKAGVGGLSALARALSRTGARESVESVRDVGLRELGESTVRQGAKLADEGLSGLPRGLSSHGRKLAGDALDEFVESTSGIFTREQAEQAFKALKSGKGRMPKPKVDDKKLKQLLDDDLYKGMAKTPGGKQVGHGSLADAARAELRTGARIFGRDHVAKAKQYIKALKRWQRRQKTGGKPPASRGDQDVAQKLINDLENAVSGS